MEEWCRFSVCYWHTFRGTGADPFGGQTLHRSWDDMSNSMENALRRADAAFEFITKLGVPFYTFHDVDAAPQGDTLAESNANFDKVRAPRGWWGGGAVTAWRAVITPVMPRDALLQLIPPVLRWRVLTPPPLCLCRWRRTSRRSRRRRA